MRVPNYSKPGYDWKKSRFLNPEEEKSNSNYGPGKGGSSQPRPLGQPSKNPLEGRPYNPVKDAVKKRPFRSSKMDPIRREMDDSGDTEITIRMGTLNRRMRKLNDSQEEQKTRKKVGY